MASEKPLDHQYRPASANNSQALINMKVVADTKKLGKPFINQLIEKFQQISIKNINSFSQNVQDKNYKDLLEMSHQFKGMCASAGAILMREVCMQIEAAARQEDEVLINTLIHNLELLLRDTIIALKQEYRV